MGYYTNYELEVYDSGNDIEEVIADLRKTNSRAEYALDEGGSCQSSCKWYEWKKDMIEFSKKYPKALFILEGKGEDPGDLWKAWFKNGKIFFSKAKFVYEEYSPDKLV